jgi:hypothetical protein
MLPFDDVSDLYLGERGSHEFHNSWKKLTLNALNRVGMKNSGMNEDY